MLGGESYTPLIHSCTFCGNVEYILEMSNLALASYLKLAFIQAMLYSYTVENISTVTNDCHICTVTVLKVQ